MKYLRQRKNNKLSAVSCNPVAVARPVQPTPHTCHQKFNDIEHNLSVFAPGLNGIDMQHVGKLPWLYL